MHVPFRDRADAGVRLAHAVGALGLVDPLVVALPRGGVPVAAELARRLGATLDLIVVRKIGCPGQPELGIGALADGGVRLLNESLISRLGLSASDVDAAVRVADAELTRRVERFRAACPRAERRGRTVLLVDDGLATGFTARAALGVLRLDGATRIALAVPVAPPQVLDDLRRLADDVVCLESPACFQGVGQYYEEFGQDNDEAVCAVLAELARPRTGPDSQAVGPTPGA